MRLFLAALAMLTPGVALAEIDVVPTVPVPEPASIAIVAAAVGGLVLVRNLRGPKR